MEQSPDELEDASPSEKDDLTDTPFEPATSSGGGESAGTGDAGDRPPSTDGPGNVAVDEPTEPALDQDDLGHG